MKHIVALSGGYDSTAVAFKLLETQPELDPIYCCTPTGRELPEMVNHWDKIGCLLGKPLVKVSHITMTDLIRINKMLPNWNARFCTRMLKIVPFQKWLLDNTPATVYIGLRADEENREGGNYDNMPDVEISYPLREMGWGRGDVVEYVDSLGLTPPARTDCDMCFFQKMSEWWLLWKNYPDRFQTAIDDEKWVSEARGKRCTYRNELKDKWGTSLEELKADFEAGKIPKNKRGVPANQLTLELTMMDDRAVMCSFCAR